MKNNTKSFTLIELLVVIAIIGILAGFIIVSMSGASSSANDSRRKADINQLSKAIMIHKVDHPETPLPIETCTIGGGATPCSSTVLSVLNNASVLRDPDSSKYYYYSSTDGNHYTISTKLSDSNDYCFDSSTGKYGTCIFSGEWVDTGLGFQVMKYEARNVDGKANSTPEGLPWHGITQSEAIMACSEIGAHLITNTEWTLMARNMEMVPENWSGNAVGVGDLARGYSANITYGGDPFSNTGYAPYTGPGYEYNTGGTLVGPSGMHLYRRTHFLSNGQVIWDFSGNANEWNNNNCLKGEGEGYWYDYTALIQPWTNVNLLDYEREQAGPIGDYDEMHKGIGKYFGCDEDGNGLVRGGGYWNNGHAGIFCLDYASLPTNNHGSLGFRCVR
ncbi:hypothetical protein MNSC_06340 [Minisyncoccus archaeophilus]|uniref:type II secretion system protein n=1 Tax=Minisyncoccus archaeiphilus TaxID=3238481 RepID=UPI00399C5BC9